eukprot:SRR837773.12804.p1 GENE.SRR837773.12804~~SRR837773.12804.p1  ORF type:complete len:806 (+),score=265.56 SRR837773.12804:59-2476(+)
MSGLYENLRQLITVIDELRDVGLQKFISLPRLVAIGTQSSGKSSLVESIVGRDFLPRGGGVVTRRPLELRLVHLNSQEYKEGDAWAVFDKISDKKYTNFDEVRQEIERQTDQVAGQNKGIVNDPIVLTVYATDAPDLTLVDLPGITRVPVKGSDQTEDIEKLTRDMTLHYIQDPRTIILAVLPANQDVSVSDALQLARHVDPQGIRSIGVVTKIDIMDQGTDASKILRGEDIPLKHGYVGVKMRSQQDINDKKPVRKALAEEKEWFESHRVYNKLPPGLVGTQVLIEKLTGILFRSMRRFLPEIKKEINEKRRSVQDRLDELGEGVPIEDGERVQVMWTMVTDYCEMFKNTIRGKYDRKLQRYMVNLPGATGPANSSTQASGGARIRGIMNDFLSDFMESSITAELSDDDIDRAIRVHEGDSLPGFPSPDTFEFLALPHLQKISIPSVECVHNVASALDLLAQRIAHAVFRRFPKMAEACLGMTQNIIQQEKDNARIIVEQQVACYVGYLFTNDPLYLTEHGSMEPMYGKTQAPVQVVEEEKPRDPGMAEKTFQSVKEGASALHQGARGLLQGQHKKSQRYSGPFVAEIRKRLDAYFAITVRNVRDSVPKAIGFYLVRAVQDKLQFELLNALNQRERLAELLGEPPHIMEERKTLSNQLQVLQKASAVLTRDPTLAAIALEAEDEEDRSQPPPPKPNSLSSMMQKAASVVKPASGPSSGDIAGTMARQAATSAAGAAAANPGAALGAASAMAQAAAQRPQAAAAVAGAASAGLFGQQRPSPAALFDDKKGGVNPLAKGQGTLFGD